MLSWDILIMDTDLHKIYNKDRQLINPNRKITIGNNVWIGCRTTVLKGSTIPAGSVIAANSVVSGSLVEDHSIYCGIPCKQIKSSIYWKL